MPILLLLILDWVEANCKESGFTSGLQCSSCDKLGDHNLGDLEGEVSVFSEFSYSKLIVKF